MPFVLLAFILIVAHLLTVRGPGENRVDEIPVSLIEDPDEDL